MVNEHRLPFMVSPPIDLVSISDQRSQWNITTLEWLLPIEDSRASCNNV